MNLERLLLRSPAALDGYFALRGALKNGRLDPQLRARIAIVVSEANGCEYGLSRSIGEARKAGLDRDAIADARGGRAKDARTGAVLAFVDGLVQGHGAVPDAELARLRTVGYGDGEMIEIVANVGLTVIANYLALTAQLPTENERVAPFA